MGMPCRPTHCENTAYLCGWAVDFGLINAGLWYSTYVATLNTLKAHVLSASCDPFKATDCDSTDETWIFAITLPMLLLVSFAVKSLQTSLTEAAAKRARRFAVRRSVGSHYFAEQDVPHWHDFIPNTTQVLNALLSNGIVAPLFLLFDRLITLNINETANRIAAKLIVNPLVTLSWLLLADWLHTWWYPDIYPGFAYSLEAAQTSAAATLGYVIAENVLPEGWRVTNFDYPRDCAVLFLCCTQLPILSDTLVSLLHTLWFHIQKAGYCHNHRNRELKPKSEQSVRGQYPFWRMACCNHLGNRTGRLRRPSAAGDDVVASPTDIESVRHITSLSAMNKVLPSFVPGHLSSGSIGSPTPGSTKPHGKPTGHTRVAPA